MVRHRGPGGQQAGPSELQADKAALVSVIIRHQAQKGTLKLRFGGSRSSVTTKMHLGDIGTESTESRTLRQRTHRTRVLLNIAATTRTSLTKSDDSERRAIGANANAWQAPYRNRPTVLAATTPHRLVLQQAQNARHVRPAMPTAAGFSVFIHFNSISHGSNYASNVGVPSDLQARFLNAW